MDLDLHQIRELPGYSNFDLIADLGGLLFLLLLIGSTITGLVYNNRAQTHLVEQLFAYEDKAEQARLEELK